MKYRKKKVPVSRPTLMSPLLIEQSYRLALLGLTNRQMAEFFDVNVSTIEMWFRENEEFATIVREGKMLADSKAAESAYKRAVGYDYTEKKTTMVKGKVYKVEISEKHMPPDVTAAFKWLALRRKSDWIEVSKSEHRELKTSVNMDMKYIQTELEGGKLSVEEMKLALKFGLMQAATQNDVPIN